MKMTKCLVFALIILTFGACQQDDAPEITTNNNGDTTMDDVEDPLSGEELVEARVELGKLLFYDPILSGGMDVACATCHHPDFGYADGRPLSIGIDATGLGPNRTHNSPTQEGFVRRNAPTIINTAFNGMDEDGNFNPNNAPMFWDNRANSLEEQALGPILSFEEMRGHAFPESVALETIVGRLEAINQYQNLFTSAFGNNAINSENIASAIAIFERSITALDSPFDRFQAGNQNAMSQAAVRGMQRFNQIGCDNCHSGPMFSDFELHTVGVPENPLLDTPDTGANGDFEFRTPTLRNLSETGPYFHNGVGGNLQQTVQFYIRARNFARNNNGNGGGPGGLNVNDNLDPQDIDNDVEDLNNFNNNDVQDIVAFINALNDPDFDRSIPNQVPSGLNVGGNIQ